MQFQETLSGITAKFIGDGKTQVTGIKLDNRKIVPGDIFCCIVGAKTDGHTLAQAAVDNGAVALLVERELNIDIPQAICNDTRIALARVAANLADNPTKKMKVVGITGTNGKTTTSFLTDHILKSMGNKTGLIGTVCISIDGEKQETHRTTPEADTLQPLFAKMIDKNCSAAVMEVSSHALDLHRTECIDFDVTAFTNLTQDHLDYHKTLNAYYQAKAKLFSSEYPAKRVININDEWGQRLANECYDPDNSLITTGLSNEADIHPISITYKSTSTEVMLSVLGEERTFTYPLVGKFNVENVMVAYAIALQLGYSKDDIEHSLKTASIVPGRLEPVHECERMGFSAYVDYAHTPDAIEKAISALKEITNGRIITVFGCGGDRDTTKRPLMGRAALLGDVAIVTSDNPRNEDPESIIQDILPGMEGEEKRTMVILDRRSAIATALGIAKEGDAILIAGKGHENYQILANETIWFNDKAITAEIINSGAIKNPCF